MTRRAISVVLALALSACGGAEERARGGAQSDPLDVDWLDGDGKITAAYLERALAIGARDPEVQAIVAEAKQRIGGGTMEGLAARFSTCTAEMGLEGGLTKVRSADALIAKGLEEVALGRRAPKTAKELADVTHGPLRDLQVIEATDYLFVKRTLLPDICVLARLPMVEAYPAIVHELVHALRTDPREVMRLARGATDEHAYDITLLLIPGGEVDAYTISTRARLRVPYAGHRISPVLSRFDPRTGALLVPPADLADVILAPAPGGLGYGQTLFRDALPDARSKLLEELGTRRDFLDHVRTERRNNMSVFAQNIDIHTHNIEVHKNNLAVAAARNDRALAARSQAGIVEAERLRNEAKILVEAARASDARISAEIASVEADMATLR